MKRKFLATCVVLVLGISLISGCGKKNTEDIKEETTESEEVIEKINLDNSFIELLGFEKIQDEDNINLRLDWEDIEGVDGYEVSFVEKFDSEEDYRTEVIERSKDSEYTFSYDEGVFVKVKVRAYKEYSDETIYSPWSNEVSDNSRVIEPEKLPYYVYDGDSEYEDAIISYLKYENKKYYDGEVMIPVIIPVKVDDSNFEDIKVWGNFVTITYDKVGHILVTRAYGLDRGLMHIRQLDSGYEVMSFDKEPDGDGYSKLLEICDGNEEMVKSFATLYEEKFDTLRLEILSDYVNANGILVDRFRDVDGTETFLINAPDFDSMEEFSPELERTPDLGNIEVEETEAGTIILTAIAENIENIDGYEFKLRETRDGDIRDSYHMQDENSFSYPFMDNAVVEIQVRAYRNNRGNYMYSNWSNTSTYVIDNFVTETIEE